jgi:hypothetical protein
VAEQVAAVLAQQNETVVSLGDFVDMSDNQTSNGAAIELVLIDELASRKITVQNRAKFKLTGTYGDLKDKDTHAQVIKITANIIETATQNVFRSIPRIVRDARTLMEFTAPTVHLGAGADPNAVEQAIVHANENPSAHVQGPRIQSTADSPFSMELVVLPRSDAQFLDQPFARLIAQAQAREAALEEGRVFVRLKLGECYMIQVRNQAAFEAAIAVNVDGLDIFQFAEEKNPLTGNPFSHYIVGPGKTVVVPGWFRTTQRSDTFLLTEYGKGAASRFLRGSPKIGTITVTFAASWEKDEDKPADEGLKGGLETGFGPPVKTGGEPVVRKIGKPRDIVSAIHEEQAVESVCLRWFRTRALVAIRF